MLRFFADYHKRLGRLHAEAEKAIAGLDAAALDWAPGPEMNSMAVLIVHLTGAERYWIGDVAGREPSGRDREAEFRVQGWDEAALRQRMATALAYSESVVTRLSLQDLAEERVAQRDGETVTVGAALLHAMEHTAMHVGHIQLVRQLLDQHREDSPPFSIPD